MKRENATALASNLMVRSLFIIDVGAIAFMRAKSAANFLRFSETT